MFFNTIVRAANGPKLYWELTLLKKPSPDLLLNVRAEPSFDRLIKIWIFGTSNSRKLGYINKFLFRVQTHDPPYKGG